MSSIPPESDFPYDTSPGQVPQPEPPAPRHAAPGLNYNDSAYKPPPPQVPPNRALPAQGARAQTTPQAPPVSGGFLEPDVLSTNLAPPEPNAMGAPSPFVTRSRVYGFVLDQAGLPIELGSGRFAKAYLGEERWVESKTSYRRHVAIKCMQSGVSLEDQMRFQMEKEILERVQGHPNIIEVIASGEGDNPHFIPPMLRDRVENDYMILELLDMSLEELSLIHI